MNPIDVAAALLSALLHAGWNAAVKNSADPAKTMMVQMVLGALLGVPALFWTGLPDLESWKWIAASTVLNTVTVMALLRAYELGGFGLVYPIVRASAVLLVVPMAALMAGDHIGPAALAGIAVIAASLGILAWDAARDRSLTLSTLGWTLLAGLGTAAYILSDAQGVRVSGSPLAYCVVVSLTNAAAMTLRQRHKGSPFAQFGQLWPVALPTAVAAMVSYLLIIWVWSHAAIASASALRDTSAVFAILIAVVWLKEPFTRTRIAAVLLAAAAIPLLRLG